MTQKQERGANSSALFSRLSDAQQRVDEEAATLAEIEERARRQRLQLRVASFALEAASEAVERALDTVSWAELPSPAGIELPGNQPVPPEPDAPSACVTPAAPRPSGERLTTQEIAALMNACGETAAGIRNRALIALLSCTGIRIMEALDIVPAELDMAGRRLHVRNGHSGNPRDVWVHQDAAAPIAAWAAVRQELGGNLAVRTGTAALFCGLKSKTISDAYLRRALPRLSRAAGLNSRVNAEVFRHSFACKAHQAGLSLRQLQIQFGHQSIATTCLYLERSAGHPQAQDFPAEDGRTNGANKGGPHGVK